MTEESPHIQGIAARVAGLSLDANPYDPESGAAAHESWESGWQAEDGVEHILGMSDADLEASVGKDEIAAAGILGRQLLAKARAALATR